MSWVGLWSSPESVVISWIVGCGHFLRLWSSPESVVISYVVVCDHVLGGSVVISWIVVCGHVLAGSVTSLGSVVISYLVVCGHLLGLWSSLGLHVFWVFIFWVCIFMSWVGLRSSSGSALIIWIVVCSMSWGFLWSCPVCGHLLGL